MFRQDKKNFHLAIRMPRLRLSFLLSINTLFLLLTVAMAAPQDDPLISEVKQGLHELDQALIRVRAFVATATACASRDMQEALAKLLKAEALRKEAESKYNRALPINDGRVREALLRSALENIRDAKARLEEAEAIVKRAADPLFNSLNRHRNNFEELVHRAEQIVIGSGNRQAERRVHQAVQQAKKIQIDAERAALTLNLCNLLNAVNAYGRAINLLKEALRFVEGSRPTPETTPETAVSREKERFDNLEARAREAMETGKNPAARPVWEQALKQARAADEAFRKGEIALAQQLYRGAARLLLRAIALAMAGQQARDYGRNEVALLQELIQTAEQEAKDNMTPREALLLARARTLAGEAEAAIERKQMPEAKWRLELARNFVDKVMRRAGGGSGVQENWAQRSDEALQELARDIEEVRAKAREANQAEALQLVELAAAAHRAAASAGQQGQPARPLQKVRLAFQMIRTAQYFLLRAETLLRESAAASAANVPGRAAVSQQLAQLENSLQALRQALQPDDPQSCQAIAAQATELSQRAQAALERGETRLALAISEVARDLIEPCLK
jgi:hypothetical protein